MSTQSPSRLLRVQTVLFGNEPAQAARLLGGLEAAARNAIAAGVVGAVEWALGDSSPIPTLEESDVSALLESRGCLANVTYEFFGANLGSSGGQNRLAADTRAEWLFVLNPDTYPSPTALVELIAAVDRARVGIAEARQIPLEHPKLYDPRSGDTSWASGCCMLVRRDVFERLGGFDAEHFLLHCDDVDFSWRVRAAGYRVVLAPLASVFHDKRPSPGHAWPAPDIERRHAVLGRLMLATRWQRDDIVEETIRSIEDGGSEIQRDAVREYRARKSSGRIPAPVDDASAAEFVDGEYAVHRF